MKQSLITILAWLTLPCLLGAQGQDHAGEDKLICPGGTTQIGTNTPCEGCCYIWSPSVGLDDPSKSNPTVSGLMGSTIYSVTVSLPNGNFEVDYVTVYTYQTTMSIFKPRFLFSNPNLPDQMVADNQKKNPGAQTIVNIDNDDCDDLFDREDNIVDGGDDEFVKIKVLMTVELPAFASPPSDNLFLLSGGPLAYSATIDLAAGSDANGIRFWRSNDKSAGPYFLGDELELTPAGGNSYEGFIWAEGLEGHTSPQQTKLKASGFGDNSATCPQNDYVSLTVIGINSVKWEGIENGYTGDGKNNSNTLDELGGQPVTTNRVFPEGKFVNNTTISAAKVTVAAKVELSTPPVESLRLYLRAIDVDDPSMETVYIDPNDLGTSGTYAGGAGLTYTKDEDNRGLVNFLVNPSFPFQAKYGAFVGTGVTCHNPNVGVFSKNASSGATTFSVDFKVSKYLGDNYRIAVHGDRDFLENLRNEDQYDQHKIVDKCTGTATDCQEIDARYTSPILVNFRTLHIEYDKMRRADVTPPANENEEIRNAYFRDFEKYTTSTGDKVISVIKDLINVSNNQPIFPNDGSPGNGRFQGGDVKIGNQPFTTRTIGQTQTDSDDVYFGYNNRYPKFYNMGFTMYGSGGASIHSGTVIDIEKPTGGNPTYQVSFYPNLPAGITSGTISLGGAAYTPTFYMITDKMVGILGNDIRIPVQLKDDDFIDNLPYEPSTEAKSVVEAAYKEAYIDAVFDGGGNMAWVQEDLAFDMNLPDPNGNYIQQTYYDGSSIPNLKPLEKDDYWGANLIFGWQAGTIEDGDPNIGEVIYLGGTPADATENDHCNLSNGWDISFIAVETNRDVYNSSGNVEEMTGRTIAHEIGHQFGLTHGENPGPCASCISDCSMVGIMTGGATNTSLNFISVHINLLRSRVKSPKK